MSIAKHLKDEGIALTADSTLPQGERNLHNFKRVIAACRAAEADFNDALNEANERCRKAQEEVISLQGKVQKLAAEVMSLKMASTLNSGVYAEKLTKEDQSHLLEMTSV